MTAFDLDYEMLQREFGLGPLDDRPDLLKIASFRAASKHRIVRLTIDKWLRNAVVHGPGYDKEGRYRGRKWIGVPEQVWQVRFSDQYWAGRTYTSENLAWAVLLSHLHALEHASNE